MASQPGTETQPEGFSQHGEDLLLWKYLDAPKTGFFVEVGANHPTQLSNSWFFERRGWNGVLVEPLPDRCAQLRSARPGSTVVEAALSDKTRPEGATFHVAVDVDVLSGLTRPEGPIQTREIRVQVLTLDHVLEKLGNPRIDFVSIDVEGTELDVLRGFSLQKHKPAVLIIEDKWRSAAHLHLKANGYKIALRTGCNSWYIPADQSRLPGSAEAAAKLERYLAWRLPLRLLQVRLKRLRKALLGR